jgi:hypothetical protein
LTERKARLGELGEKHGIAAERIEVQNRTLLCWLVVSVARAEVRENVGKAGQHPIRS